MNRSALVLFLYSYFLILNSLHAEFGREYRTELLKALDSPTSIIVYSLNPEPEFFSQGAKSGDVNHRLHGVRVLGFTFLQQKDFTIAVNSVKEAITKWQPDASACMDQFHHAIRINAGGKTYDLMICYECDGLNISEGNKDIASIRLYGKSDGLNKLLTDAQIPMVKLPVLPEDGLWYALLEPSAVSEFSLGGSVAGRSNSPSFHGFLTVKSNRLDAATFRPLGAAVIRAWHKWDGVWIARPFQPTRGLHMTHSKGAYDLLFDFKIHRMIEFSNNIEVGYPGIGITKDDDVEKNLKKLFNLSAKELAGN